MLFDMATINSTDFMPKTKQHAGGRPGQDVQTWVFQSRQVGSPERQASTLLAENVC